MPTHLTEVVYFFDQKPNLRVWRDSAIKEAKKIADRNGFLTADKLRQVLGVYAKILEKEACDDPMYHKLTMLAISARKMEFRPFEAHPTEAEWEKAIDLNGDYLLLWDLLQHIAICDSCYRHAPEIARKIKEAVDNAEVSEEELSHITVPDHVIEAAQGLVKPKT